MTRTVLVTGASSGIGRAACLAFAAEGDAVLALARGVAELTELAKCAHDLAGSIEVVDVDVTDRAALGKAISLAIAALDQRLDVVVVGAGVTMVPGVPVEALEDSDWDRIIATNLSGAMATIRAAIPHMNDGGSIVTIASIAALRPELNAGPYSASKAGLLLLSQTIALELAGRGIRVNSVCPAAIDTPLVREYWDREADPDAARAAAAACVPLRRVGTPEEVAAAITFLSSKQAAFVTGAHLVIDGGSSLRGVY